MFCAKTRYEVNVYRTIGSLVVFAMLRKRDELQCIDVS